MIHLGDGLTVVSGRNGQGKTSLLEAIYLLGTTKSFRTAQPREMIGVGATDAVVAGEISEEGGRSQRIAVRLGSNPSLKEFVRDGRAVKAAEYLGGLNPVAFTAESRLLIGGPPEARRAFMDRGVAAEVPGYLTELAGYRSALRQKARLLEQGARLLEIEAWNMELGRWGARVNQERTRWTENLKSRISVVSRRIFGDGKEIEVRYRPSPAELGDRELGEDVEIREKALLSALGRLLPAEMRARRSLGGPQRDDLEITLAGRDAAAFASAGEQRRTAFVLVISALEIALDAGRGSTLLLVDDVEAELDDDRLDKVFEFLRGASQSLVTTSKADVVRRSGASGSVLTVEQGRIEAA